MKKCIYVDKNKQRAIADSCKCTQAMVSYALNFKKDSELARKIRFVAMSQYGGVPNWQIVMDTVHTQREMIQCFGEEVRLVLDKKNRRVRLEECGKVLTESSDPHIEEYVRLQDVAWKRAVLG